MKGLVERFIKKGGENPKAEGETPPFKAKAGGGKRKKLILAIGGGTVISLLLIGGLLWWFSEDEEEYPTLPSTPPPITKPIPHAPPTGMVKAPAHIPPKGNTTPRPVAKAPPTPAPKPKPKPQPKREVKEEPTLNIPPQFVGVYLQKALEDIKQQIKREMEAKAQRGKQNEKQGITLDFEAEPNLPKTITVQKVMQMPDGTIMVYYNGKWYSKGMDMGDGWIIENIDDKYIYLKKTFKRLIPEGNKIKEEKIVKHAKIGYLIAY